MKTKMASSKKILIASILIGVLLVGSVITIVAVLAAQTQSVTSQITVSYVVDDVGAKVSGTYATVPLEGTITKTAMTGGDNGVLEFKVDDSQKPLSETQLSIENIELKSTEDRVVFEYRFENTSEKAFTIELAERPTETNMDIRYKVSADEVLVDAYRGDYEMENLYKQVLLNQGDTMYVYIFVTIRSLNSPASYLGNLTWNLLKINEEDRVQISLENNGGTDGLTEITAVKGAAMPFMTTLPNSPEAGKAFAGYYNGEDKYVSANGEGVKLVESAMTLTARYDDSAAATLNMVGGIVYGLSETANNVTNVVIPNEATEIAEGAFENNTEIQKVTIGETSVQSVAYADESSRLNKIGIRAFAGCSNLAEVSFAENISLETVSAYAFKDCLALTELEIPGSVKVIENYALDGCLNIASLTIPAQVTKDANMEAFQLQDYANVHVGLQEIYGYNTLVSAVVGGPSSGLALANVKFVGNGKVAVGFLGGCATIQTIEVAGDIEEVGIAAFGMCMSLQSVVIGDSVKSIGAYAFMQSAYLNSIELGNSLTEIGVCAFLECASLSSITLPSSVSLIRQSAFSDSGIQSITFEDTTNWYIEQSELVPCDVSSLTVAELNELTYSANLVAGTFSNVTKTNNSSADQYISSNGDIVLLSYEKAEAKRTGDEYIVLKAGQSVSLKQFFFKTNNLTKTVSVASSKPSDIASKLFITNYGEYPQTYVGDALNETLKGLADSYKTGKSYTTAVYYSGSNSTPTTLEEYLYNGKKYAKLTNSNVYNTGTKFTTEDICEDSKVYFFLVEPIIVKAMESDGETAKVMSMSSLGSVQFEQWDDETQGSAYYDNSWKNSDIRAFLNSSFLTESGLNSVAVETTIKNDDYFNTSPDDSDTTDKIWLASAEEIITWSGSGDSGMTLNVFIANSGLGDNHNMHRKVKPSDMALASYTYYYEDYDAGWYFLRSPGNIGNYVCYVNDYGYVLCANTYGSNSYGFCPAFVINL